jgi:hypothetical protein
MTRNGDYNAIEPLQRWNDFKARQITCWLQLYMKLKNQKNCSGQFDGKSN